MPALGLVIAPDPIFRRTAETVATVDDQVRQIVSDMIDTMYLEKGLGIGANMVGILKRIVVIDMQEDGQRNPIALINPEIVEASQEQQTFPEASLSYPGIKADITRPKHIVVTYLDTEGEAQRLEASDWFAQVLQHEIDYLDGKVFLDYLKPVKRQMLMKKMQKYKRSGPPHAHSHHGDDCACC